MHETADLVLVNGKITTLDRANPQARAVAIRILLPRLRRARIDLFADFLPHLASCLHV